MSTRASAARYARALLDVVIREADPEAADRDLRIFADVLQKHPELESALTHPSVPAARKKAATQAVLSQLNLSGPVAKLLLMLAERDRLTILGDVIDVYHERLLEHQRVLQAEVTTAVPLSAERVTELQQRLARATGRSVIMTTKVDPQIIGGLIARIGSTVYDGSVAAKLWKMKESLVGQ